MTFLKENEEWREWGHVDPLYAVASLSGRERGGIRPWTASEFYASGADDWQVFMSAWRRYGVRADCCVEIGCGAGRLTAHLAGDFLEVHALDVSGGMLEEFRKHIHLPNVVLHYITRAEIPLPDTSATAVFSSHVFQHFPDIKIACSYFDEAHRVLTLHGTIMIHLPVTMWPSGRVRPIHRALDAATATLSRAGALCREAAFKAGLRKQPTMRGRWYEASWLHGYLKELGFKDIQINVLYHESEMAHGCHGFVLARKVK